MKMSEVKLAKMYPELSQRRYDTLKARLRIDQSELDRCIMQQSETFEEVASAVGKLISLRDQAKFEMENVTAREELLVRRRFPDEKEGLIKAKLKERKAVVEANENFLFFSSQVRKWDPIQNAFEQRRSMLKYLVEIMHMRYTMPSSIEGGGGFSMEELSRTMKKEALKGERQSRRKRVVKHKAKSTRSN